MAIVRRVWQALIGALPGALVDVVLDAVLGSTCAGCGRRGAGAACADCRHMAEAHPRIAGTTFLDEAPVSQLVRAAKFGRWRGGGAWFARHMVARLDPTVRSRVVAVAWVPRSPERARARGVDLPRDVARRVAAQLGVPTLDALVRIRGSTRQRGLDRDERRANARASFDLGCDVDGRVAAIPVSIEAAPGPVVLLVDDVCTTGSTINACSALLTVACRRRFRDIHVHPIAIASVPMRGTAAGGVTNSRSLRGKCIHVNR